MDGHNAGFGASTRDGSQPVFVDRTGRRRRITVLAGASIAVGLLVSLGLIVAGLFGGSTIPLPGWPDSNVPRQGEAEIRPSADPELTTPPQPVVATTSRTARPSPAPSPTTAPGSRPTGTDRPGANDPTRIPPGHRPGKSPGKPN